MKTTHDFRICDMLVDDLRQEIDKLRSEVERLRQANTELCANIVATRKQNDRAAELLRACDEELSGKWFERRDQWLIDAGVEK